MEASGVESGRVRVSDAVVNSAADLAVRGPTPDTERPLTSTTTGRTTSAS